MNSQSDTTQLESDLELYQRKFAQLQERQKQVDMQRKNDTWESNSPKEIQHHRQKSNDSQGGTTTKTTSGRKVIQTSSLFQKNPMIAK